ncbi:hypothetical protein GQ42DRAFT_73940 [Ramicandelaber brevisporus]|nr:hypothetical protein GQ42DRAFT_73940 [Ramicandelaber brevisporus]
MAPVLNGIGFRATICSSPFSFIRDPSVAPTQLPTSHWLNMLLSSNLHLIFVMYYPNIAREKYSAKKRTTRAPTRLGITPSKPTNE